MNLRKAERLPQRITFRAYNLKLIFMEKDKMNRALSFSNEDLEPPASVNETRARNSLAFGITGISIVGVILLSITIVVVRDTDVNSRAQNIMNAVLPLLGTWVGTVLAYFFSRENFESASRSVERLTGKLTYQEKLKSTSVTSAMTLRHEIFSVTDPETVMLVDILKELEEKHIKRLPVFDHANHIQALVFRDGIVDFLYRYKERTDEERRALTLSELLAATPSLKQMYAIASTNDSLGYAQEAMSRIPECGVVFVTQSGRADDEVLGMLTNADFAEMLQEH
jgi:hypothetical protein